MGTIKKQFLSWFDKHGLFSLSLFLLFFIPLYPKIPLAEAIPGYLVRIRLEDLLVLATSLIWFVQLLRKKIEWKTSFHFLIIGYSTIGLASLLVAIGLQQTITPHFVHLSKSILHYFRYLEYFSLFLIFHSAIKSKKHTQIALTSLIVILNLIFIYGVGQRYFEFPAFSTMNREFSKGEALILAPTTKLHSTFGGHYDLAAYLVIVLPILSAWALRSKKRIFQFWLGISILGGFWLLKESASKMSLAATMISIAGVIWFSLYQRWGGLKSILIGLIGGTIIASSTIGVLWMWQKPTIYKFAPFLRPAVYQTPVDVVGELDETWSENARKYGLSMGIRLDTLWPNALNSFSTNPFTGKGYATLNKVGDEFVEADSTDNNFLRVLGETGLLGFIAFFSLIVLIIKTLLLKLPKNEIDQALTIGFIASTVGLFINALIIDVFSASKVAFTYWALAGLVIKNYLLQNEKLIKQKELERFKKFSNWLKNKWPILLAGVFLILLVHKQPFTEYSLVKSFDTSPKQAKYVAATKCLFESNSWQSCINKYEPSLGVVYSIYLLPFYAIYHEPAVYYFANLILIIGSLILFDSIIKKFNSNHTFRFLLLTIIATTPSVYSLPTKSSPINLLLFLILLFANNFSFKIKPKNISKKIIYGLLFITLVHLGLVQYFMNMTSGILASYRDTYKPNSFVAIRKANSFFPTKITKNAYQPILLTIIEPEIFDLYGQDGFLIETFTNEKLNIHKDLIIKNQEQKLFITNANTAKNPKALEIFEEYKDKFGIKLKEIECRHECNYYQLLIDDIVIPTQPESWNEKILKIYRNEFKFLVVNNKIINYLSQSKQTKTSDEIKQNLISQNPDLIFLVGDAKDNLEKNYGKLFLQRTSSYIREPIVSVLSNSNQSQIFEINNNWFITLDAGGHHMNPAQNIFIYNALLQLEKHPNIKNVFIISDNPEWLERDPSNYWFVEDFPKQLEKHESVSFKLIFGATEREINSQLPGNVEAFFNDQDKLDFNSYLEINVKEEQVLIEQIKFIKN
jgi:O-antigen ligase